MTKTNLHSPLTSRNISQWKDSTMFWSWPMLSSASSSPLILRLSLTTPMWKWFSKESATPRSSLRYRTSCWLSFCWQIGCCSFTSTTRAECLSCSVWIVLSIASPSFPQHWLGLRWSPIKMWSWITFFRSGEYWDCFLCLDLTRCLQEGTFRFREPTSIWFSHSSWYCLYSHAQWWLLRTITKS